MVRQWRLVLLNTGSHTHKMAGMRNRLTRAEMRAPRASMTQMEPMRSMEETKDTPNVAQNSTNALVTMEASAASAATRMASIRGRPFRSSSWKREVMRMA